jgi:hypothetical protein
MRRQGDRMGTSRLWLSLLCVSALALLSGCGWLFGGGPDNTGKARPGVDRKAPATGALPAATGGGHDAGVMASDPAGNATIGSIVQGKGGQKAQKEVIEKEATERDAKEREARDKREAEERDAKAKEQPETPPNMPTGNIVTGVPPKPAAAEPGNATPPATGNAPIAPASSPAAPGGSPTAPAPVTTAPIAPAQPAQPNQPAPAPERQPAAPPRT